LKLKIIQIIISVFILWLPGCSGDSHSLQIQTIIPTNLVQTPTITITSSPTSTVEILQGTVSIWHSLNEPYISSLVQVIVDFQNLYPDVQFDVLYLPENIIMERYKSAVQEGRAPTILLGPAKLTNDLVSNNLVEDLSGRLSSELIDRVGENVLAGGKLNEFQAGLPFMMDGIVLYRNTDLIPNPVNSWQELVTNAQTATKAEQVGTFFDRGFYFSGAHLESLGGKLMNSDNTPAFNNEYGYKWVKLLQEFEHSGPTAFLVEDDATKFMEGNVGYLIESTKNRQTYAEKIGSQKLAIDPWPSFETGKLAGYLTTQNIYLNKNNTEEEKKSGWKFAEFILSPEAQTRFSDIGWIPVVKDAITQAPLIQQAMIALSGDIAYPLDSVMELYRTTLDVNLQSIFNGALTIEEGLKNAESSILNSLSNSSTTPEP
jgi:ABC-type glycerol-3-phosphate transport system substrate-binding protein